MDGTLEPGQQLGSYRVEALLGRGGMGVVYRAEQTAMGRRVALKVLAPELAGDEGFRQRFLRESRIAARLDHPNVIPIYDTGEIDGRLYIAMRYVDGADLHVLIRSSGQMEPPRAFGLLRQVAGALDAAHARGVVHRDVKPANVLVTGGTASQAGEADEHVYLCDFGIGKHPDATSELTRTGEMLGTASYLSPEQARGEPADGRADAYALACVLFECLTGGVPFVRDTAVATVAAHLQAPVPAASAARPELGDELDAVFRMALAKHPGDRYPSCRAMIAAAQEAYDHAARAPGPPPRAASARRPSSPTARLDRGVPPAAPRGRGRGRDAPRWRRAGLALGVLTLAAVLAVMFAVRAMDRQEENPGAAGPPQATSPASTPAPSSVPAGGQLPVGAPTEDCVTGWTTPAPDTPPRAAPLNAIRAATGLTGQFFVEEMRLFVAADGVSRWYVRASQVDDPSIRGRWLVEQEVGGEAAVVAQAPYVSRGFAEGDWETVGPDGPTGDRYGGLPDQFRGCLSGD